MNRNIIYTALVAASAVIILFFYISSGSRVEMKQNARNCFNSERDYLDYLKNEVSFKTVGLNFISVKKGDNFWKLAKVYGVNIDTLIGVNLYWDDLKAKTNQVVVVPSAAGIIEFIYDLDDVKELAKTHEVKEGDIEIQKLPLFYSLYYKLKNDRKPVAVFIKDAKPTANNMSANLAGRFTQREQFRSPLGGRLSSFFGNRKHPIFRDTRFHNGLDIAAPYGTLIGAARDGVVVSAGWNGGYGKAVIIEHGDGYKTMYGHMSQIYAKPGQSVKAGKIIGRVGSTGLSTGPHLHFTLWRDGKLLNPMDILW